MKQLLILVSVMCALLADARLPDLIPYRKGNLWGYCDSTKKIVIEPQWNSTYTFCGTTAAVSNGKKFALIDSTGRIVAPLEYEYMNVDAVNGKRIVYSRNGKKAGLIDDHGKLVLPMRYDYLKWCGNYLSAGLEKKSGIIDTDGKTIIPFGYLQDPNTISWSDSGKTFFAMRKKEGYGVINDSGAVVVPFKYHWMEMRYNQLTGYSSTHSTDYFDRQGRYTGTSGIEYAFEVKYYLWATPKDSFPPNSEPVMGWVGTDGKWLNPVFYHSTSEFSCGLARIQTPDKLYGFVNEKFDVVISPEYAFVGLFSYGGLALAYKKVVNNRGIPYREALGYIDIYGTEYWED